MCIASNNFSTDCNGAIEQADVIFIAVNTPHKDEGQTGYNMSAYENVTRLIAKQSTNSKIIIEKSTVPVHTAKHMEMILNSNKQRDDINFEILSNPEFLAEVS